MEFTARHHRFVFPRLPVVMGIVNVTPDSFSDGGRHATPTVALAHCERLLADGAHMLDIGGESTRPGALPLPLDEELARVRVHAQRQLNGIRSRLNGTTAPNENVVERVQSNAEERRRSRPRERPATTTDGRVIDWKSVKKLYLRNRSHKQTAAAFDLSVNTVKARARKEGWAQ